MPRGNKEEFLLYSPTYSSCGRVKTFGLPIGDAVGGDAIVESVVGAIDNEPTTDTNDVGEFVGDETVVGAIVGAIDTEPTTETEDVGEFVGDETIVGAAVGAIDTEPATEAEDVGEFVGDETVVRAAVGAIDPEPSTEPADVGEIVGDDWGLSVIVNELGTDDGHAVIGVGATTFLTSGRENQMYNNTPATGMKAKYLPYLGIVHLTTPIVIASFRYSNL